MIQLKSSILTVKSKAQLKAMVKKHLAKYEFHLCKALNKRPVFLEKWLDANLNRVQSVSRLQSFFCGIELIKKSVDVQKNIKNHKEYELIGKSKCGKNIKVHIREEEENKDRLLFYVSSYQADN